MGHALDHTLIDSIIRRKRMQGYATLWLPGADHAGIATQTKVEAKLKETEGKKRWDYEREEFIGKVWEWKEQYGGTIQNQMRAIGDSVDWSRERFTLDDGLSRAVQTIFKNLYDEGMIYQANRLVNWSPVLETAVSDIEVVYKDVEGELVSIRYGSLNDAGHRLNGDWLNVGSICSFWIGHIDGIDYDAEIFDTPRSTSRGARGSVSDGSLEDDE